MGRARRATRETSPEEQSAYRDRIERLVTDSETLAAGMPLRGGLGKIAAVRGEEVSTTAEPTKFVHRSTVTVDLERDTTLSTAALGAMDATVIGRTQRQIRLAVNGRTVVVGLDTDMPEAMQILFARQCLQGMR